MAQTAKLHWARATHQTRSRETAERILDAAEALLVERGFDQVGVAEIAQRAGSSVGAFYARFRDKNGLLQSLHQRFTAEALATMNDVMDPRRWEGASAAEIIASLIEFILHIHSQRANLLRAFFFHGCNDPHFLHRDRDLAVEFMKRLQGLLGPHMKGMRHPEPARAIEFGMGMVVGVLKNTFILQDGLAELLEFSPEDLRNELCQVYCAYLGLNPPRQARFQGGKASHSAAKESRPGQS